MTTIVQIEVGIFNGPYKRADRLPVDAHVIWDGEICKVENARFVKDNRITMTLEITDPKNPPKIIDVTVSRDYEFRTVIIRAV